MLMSRRIVAFLIAIYAIAFAFGAMAAIRWPSLMLLAGLMVEPDALGGLNEINWRELGIAFGAPYFLAALCFMLPLWHWGAARRTQWCGI